MLIRFRIENSEMPIVSVELRDRFSDPDGSGFSEPFPPNQNTIALKKYSVMFDFAIESGPCYTQVEIPYTLGEGSFTGRFLSN